MFSVTENRSILTKPYDNCQHSTVKIFPGYSQVVNSQDKGKDFPTHKKIPVFCWASGKTSFLLLPISPRGQIKNFSAKSRLRFLKKVCALAEQPKFFMTLTYPGAFEDQDARVWKTDLDNFSRELKRTFPESWFFWKLEPQERGAPHFHLMGDFSSVIPSLGNLRQKISRVWYRVVGSNDPRHLRAGVQIDYVRADAKGKLGKYLSKYVGKAIDDAAEKLPAWSLPGRFWGVLNRKNLPPEQFFEVGLEQAEYFQFRRLIRRWCRIRSRRYSDMLRWLTSYPVFLFDDTISKILQFITGDGFHSCYFFDGEKYHHHNLKSMDFVLQPIT